jgi:hypothetical protein
MKQKEFKEENLDKNSEKEDEDMPRVRGHLRRVPRGRRRVRVRPHRRIIRRSSLRKFFGG